MTQYNTLNIKLSNSQLNKLKYAIENGTEVTLNLSSNIIGYSNDENNFPIKLLLTNTWVSMLRKAFAINCLANIKWSKTQLHKIQSGGFLGRLLGPLLKTRFSFIGNVLTLSAKSFLIPLGLTTAAASATDATSHKKMFGSGFTTSIISNEEINDIMKIVKSLEESGSLIKGLRKEGFLRMLLGTFRASLLGNLLTDKGEIATSQARGTIRADENFQFHPIL